MTRVVDAFDRCRVFFYSNLLPYFIVINIIRFRSVLFRQIRNKIRANPAILRTKYYRRLHTRQGYCWFSIGLPVTISVRKNDRNYSRRDIRLSGYKGKLSIGSF